MQNTSDVFVVFKSNQIKDATGENNGDFSNEYAYNNDYDYSVPTTASRVWFGTKASIGF